MKRLKNLMLMLLAALLLSGCAMRTVDQLYCLPKRSEKYKNLQQAIDRHMTGLEYCAPLSGEYQQAVQKMDLNGDGVAEYLVFAKGSGEEKPLHILVFSVVEEEYVHTATLQSSGSAFDQVEYVDMDGQPGVEIVVGRQVSNQVPRSVSVYSMANDLAEPVLTASYTRFLTCDLDADQRMELMLFRPGEQEGDSGVVEWFQFQEGLPQRYAQATMSEPVEHLKRMITGHLQGGENAVFAASRVDDTTIITDVYALVSGELVNISQSHETGISTLTMRSNFVYADDIDDDGVMELPGPVACPVPREEIQAQQCLLRWYALSADGREWNKLYTYHNFSGGWYVELQEGLAISMVVSENRGDSRALEYTFSIDGTEKLLTVYVLTGDNREIAATQDNRFVLQATDTTVYAARLEVASAAWGISPESLSRAFHLIRMDWKTGET